MRKCNGEHAIITPAPTCGAASTPIHTLTPNSTSTACVTLLQGSGILCGFRASIRSAPEAAGIIELSPIFLNPITSAEITNVVYPKGWEGQQGPLQPQVAASLRVDSRAR